MNTKIHIFILSFLLLYQPAQPVIIVIHGSFASESMWCTPGGDFFDELEAQALKYNQKVIPFHWSGNLGMKSKLKAAHCLAKIILSYPATEKIILVGHSHGGNVINLASQLIHYAREHKKDSSFMLFASQFAEDDDEGIENKDDEKIERINELITVEGELEKEISADTKNAEPSPEQPALAPTHLIDTVYMLATPVYAKKYSPHRSVVRQAINIYSKGDYIQRVGGLYSRHFPSNTGVINVRIFFSHEKSKKLIDPGHSELHARLVAQWLLAIPEDMRSDISSGGHLILRKDTIPTFIPNAPKRSESGAQLKPSCEPVRSLENVNPENSPAQ